MVAKIMEEQKICQSCGEKQVCQSIYHKLGKSKGPSVVFAVILAFLAHIAVFITILAISQQIIDSMIVPERLQITISFLLAVLSVFIYVLIIRTTGKKIFTNK